MATHARLADWLAVVVAAPPAVRRPDDLAALPACADVIELRFDLLLDPADPSSASIVDWMGAAPRPVLATVRSRAEGGAFDGTAEDAAALLREAHAAGATLIDAEAGVFPLLSDLGEARVLSSHGWDRIDVKGHHSAVTDTALGGGVRRKIAVPVDDAAAWARCRRIAESSLNGPVVPYGALGMARGAFAGQSGALLFGAATDGGAVVSGQPPLRRLLDELRVGEVDPDVELYGLVGAPPAWSPSPALHNAVFRAEERKALYVPIPVPLEAALALPVRGLSVTTPHKASALARADAFDDSAAQVGAANTLMRAPGGRWAASNTDVTAIAGRVGLLKAARGQKAFVYGAGGYARAAVVALGALGYVVRLGARNGVAGAATADDLDVDFAGDTYQRHANDAVWVNATPAGARGEDIPFLTDRLEGLTVVDAPYGAEDAVTSVVERALADGATRIVDGRALLVAQAIGQARAFGSALDDERLATVLGLAVRPRTVWLLGLRAAGKSTAGRALERLGRPFVDLDAEVERVAGPIETLVEQHGWAAFRALECEALERVADRRGVVVATGGGVVEDERNVQRLAAHPGLRLWLDIDPALSAARVALSSRPRLPEAKSPEDEARAADRRRRPHFDALADVRIDANDEARVLDAVVAALLDASA